MVLIEKRVQNETSSNSKMGTAPLHQRYHNHSLVEGQHCALMTVFK